MSDLGTPPPPGSQLPPPPTPPNPYYQTLPPPMPQRSRSWIWVLVGVGILGLFFLSVFALLIYSVSGKSDSVESGSGLGGGKIAVVDVEGVILDARKTVDIIKRYGDDDSVKAIILRIDSPGGGAAASQEIYNEVKRVRDVKKKRIVASIESVGASGAYYIASGTNKIYASPASIVGSIGVIAEWVNYEDLMKWAKLKDVTLKAGELKDAGSPSREMTPAERAYLQSLIDDMHGQFIHDVATGRGMKDEDIKPIASGRVWTGQQALPLKLIDQLGDYETAVEQTAKDVGINGEPTIVRPAKPRHTIWDIMTGDDVSDLIPNPQRLMQKNMGFYYLWK